MKKRDTDKILKIGPNVERLWSDSMLPLPYVDSISFGLGS